MNMPTKTFNKKTACPRCGLEREWNPRVEDPINLCKSCKDVLTPEQIEAWR